QFTDPDAAARDPFYLPPALTGSLKVKADRIAYDGASTELSNLDADLRFDGEKMHVSKFSAMTQIVNPRFASKKPSDPITISGDLAMRGAAPGLTIRAPRVLFAEAPLPKIGSGAAVGEISTDDPGTTGAVESIKVTGTVFNPTISGTIYARNGVFK